jgi:uncharacterized membrane protein
MEPSSMHYFPLAWPFLLILGALVIAAFTIVELQILTTAYVRMGIHPRFVFTILLLSILGSYVNIPVAQLPPERVVSDTTVDYFGMQYVVPRVQRWPQTIIAVNVGGAVIPVLLSLYLAVKNGLYWRSIFAIFVVAMIVHRLAQPVHGVGISVPIFVQPLVAAGVAMLFSLRRAPALAYIAGSMGTLIGADLMNLDRIQGLGAPIASIGGAGTFDGIFLTGIIAVLLPPVGQGKRSR